MGGVESARSMSRNSNNAIARKNSDVSEKQKFSKISAKRVLWLCATPSSCISSTSTESSPFTAAGVYACNNGGGYTRTRRKVQRCILDCVQRVGFHTMRCGLSRTTWKCQVQECNVRFFNLHDQSPLFQRIIKCRLLNKIE